VGGGGGGVWWFCCGEGVFNSPSLFFFFLGGGGRGNRQISLLGSLHFLFFCDVVKVAIIHKIFYPILAINRI